jgi:hypothetical protein
MNNKQLDVLSYQQSGSTVKHTCFVRVQISTRETRILVGRRRLVYVWR